MKTTLLTVAINACTISLFAQGTVNFNNRNTAAGLFVPIHGPIPQEQIPDSKPHQLERFTTR